MDFDSVNWLAVIAWVVLSGVIGFIWYHPAVFLKAGWKGIGKSEKDKANPTPVLYVYSYPFYGQVWHEY
jgi:hypothetical protein